MTTKMRRAEIRKWFIDQGARCGLTQRRIAEEAGVSFQLVTMVLAGTRKNEAVLEALGKHGFPSELLKEKEVAV
jgi:transposase